MRSAVEGITVDKMGKANAGRAPVPRMKSLKLNPAALQQRLMHNYPRDQITSNRKGDAIIQSRRTTPAEVSEQRSRLIGDAHQGDQRVRAGPEDRLSFELVIGSNDTPILKLFVMQNSH